MRAKRAFLLGIVGAAAISALSAVLRVTGLPIYLELVLGSTVGLAPGPLAFAVGLAMHLAIGGAFGLLYGWLFETVWDHGGAGTGMILAVIHAALVGMVVGLAPQLSAYIPERLADPGPYFANGGPIGAIAFFTIHIVYGAIVGGGYGHVAAESEWAPAGRI